MNGSPNSILATGHVETHFLFTESPYLSCLHILVHVLFVVYEKYPTGQPVARVTHFPVKGLEKYPSEQ